ncbi:hypothetical protein [Catellatospora paridis]|uniref:hypothetical protein n=1 Tax=Catellatospora paridis TaxID=1617086 RepID=UPI0012D41376|nr:hypothetical protein [Catellatospora paridis]
MKRLKIVQVFMVAALSLAACSETGEPAVAPAGGASASAPAAGGKSLSADALCAYLREQVPVLKGIGSEVGRKVNLAANLATFFDQQGAKPENAGQLDELVKTGCADVRTEILTLTGMDSFAQM